MQPKSLDKAQQLFDEFDADGNGRLSLDELRALLKSASQEYSHLSEHARFLEGCAQRLCLSLSHTSPKPHVSPCLSHFPCQRKNVMKCTC